jgi:hypothetical protein
MQTGKAWHNILPDRYAAINIGTQRGFRKLGSLPEPRTAWQYYQLAQYKLIYYSVLTEYCWVKQFRTAISVIGRALHLCTPEANIKIFVAVHVMILKL